MKTRIIVKHLNIDLPEVPWNMQCQENLSYENTKYCKENGF